MTCTTKAAGQGTIVVALVISACASTPIVNLEHETEIMREAGELAYYHASDAGVVTIKLRAAGEAKAAALARRYGDSVNLYVGDLPYPPEEARGIDHCEAPQLVPEFRRSDVKVVMTVAPPDPTTGDGDADLLVENQSAGTIVVVAAAGLHGVLVDRASSTTMSSYPYGSIAAMSETELGPGESAELRVQYSIASCSGDRGYTVPPGDYWLVTSLEIDGTSAPVKAPLQIGES